MENKIEGKVVKILTKLIIIVLCVCGIYFLYNYLKPENWTLMVCKTKLNDSECYDTSYEIPGFESSKACLLEGTSRFLKEGFECGSDCKTNSYGLKICQEICNSSGCKQ